MIVRRGRERKKKKKKKKKRKKEKEKTGLDRPTRAGSDITAFRSEDLFFIL